MAARKATDDTYRVVRSSLWCDPQFRSLSPLAPSGQALLWFLLTGHDGRAVPGLFRAWADAIAASLQWTADDVRRHLEELERAGLIKYDPAVGLIWISAALDGHRPQSPSVTLSWGRMARRLPECGVLASAVGEIEQFLQAKCSRPFLRSWRRGYQSNASPAGRAGCGGRGKGAPSSAGTGAQQPEGGA